MNLSLSMLRIKLCIHGILKNRWPIALSANMIYMLGIYAKFHFLCGVNTTRVVSHYNSSCKAVFLNTFSISDVTMTTFQMDNEGIDVLQLDSEVNLRGPYTCRFFFFEKFLYREFSYTIRPHQQSQVQRNHFRNMAFRKEILFSLTWPSIKSYWQPNVYRM